MEIFIGADVRMSRVLTHRSQGLRNEALRRRTTAYSWETTAALQLVLEEPLIGNWRERAVSLRGPLSSPSRE